MDGHQLLNAVRRQCTSFLPQRGEGRFVDLGARLRQGALVVGAIDLRYSYTKRLAQGRGSAAEAHRVYRPALCEGQPAQRLQALGDAAPVTFETGADEEMDAIVVASAPEAVQRARVLARPGMTVEKFESLKARQMDDAEKRQQAHYVVMTDKGLDHARQQVKMILADIRNKLAAFA